MSVLDRLTRAAVLCGLFAISLQAAAQEKLVVMGAGPSTVVAQLFFDQISKHPGASKYIFEIDARSIKHAGGVRSSDTHLFGRTGRPLNDAERSQNKKEIFLARIPVSVVAGRKAGISQLTLAQLESIVTGKIRNWRDVGGADHPILLMGREPTEAAFSVLKSTYPFFSQAVFDETLTRDHQVVNFLRSPKGDYAISFGAKPNFDGMPVMSIEGFDPSLSIGLVYDAKHSDHPLVQLVQAQAKGSAWQQLLKQTDFYPPE